MIMDVPRASFGEIWTLRGAARDAAYAVVSDDRWNEAYPTVFVIELEYVTGEVITGTGRCMVDEASGTVALVDALTTAHERQLVEHIGGLTKTQMQCIADAMREVPLDYCIRGAARPAVAAAAAA
jgi:mRNA-degrading endonuclease toxin of MazEF toxin-antitoxin module